MLMLSITKQKTKCELGRIYKDDVEKALELDRDLEFPEDKIVLKIYLNL